MSFEDCKCAMNAHQESTACQVECDPTGSSCCLGQIDAKAGP